MSERFVNFDTGIPRPLAAVFLADPSANAMPSVTVSQLPSAATYPGAQFMVTDSTMTLAAGLGNPVAGTGANIVRVFSNASAWIIG